MKNILFLSGIFSFSFLLCHCGEGEEKVKMPEIPDKEPTPTEPVPFKDFAPESLSSYYLKETTSVIKPTRNQYYFFADNSSCSFKEVSTGPASGILDDVLMTDEAGTYTTTGTYTYKKTGKTTATLSINTEGTWGTKPYSRSATFTLSFNDETSVMASEKLTSSGGTKNGSRSVYFRLTKTL